MKVRKIGISSKIFIAVIVLLVLSDVSIGMVVYQRSKNLLETQIKQNAMNIDRCVAASVDGKKVASIHKGDEGSKDYQDVIDSLTLFLDNSGVEYVYTIRQEEGKKPEFIVDSDPEEPGMPGDEFGDSSKEIDRALAGDTTVDAEPYTDEWGTHISAYSPIYDGDTVVALAVVDLSMDWVNKKTGSIRLIILIICLLVLAAGIVVMVIIHRIMQHGFVTLNDKISELSQGDGDLTKTIELKSGDEFEVIAGNVNHLLDYIHEMMINISKHSGDLQSSTKQFVGDMVKSQENVTDVSATMQELSATMQESAAIVEQIYTLVKGIKTSFQGIDKTLQNGNEYSSQMKTDAEDIGKKAVAEQKNAVAKVEKMKEAVQQRIDKSKDVEQIKMLTENILEITEQTNLLSLNASIEAARAGEHGKGFGVVASEIGHLAQNSAETATRIQEVSDNVTAAVNALAKEAQAMIEYVNEIALNGYDDLVKTSKSYYDSAEHMDEIMRECARISEKIRTNIDTINEHTKSVTDSVSEAANGVVDAADKTADLTNHLQNMGKETDESQNLTDELFTEIGRFKM